MKQPAEPSRPSPLPRLMLVTDRRRVRGRSLVDVVAAAARGGVGLVQIREPDLPDDEIRELVSRIKSAVVSPATVLVNGRVRVARTLRVGLHLPARAPLLGATDLGGRLFGRSIHDDEEMRRAVEDGPDYLLLGTIFATESKPGRRGSGVALVERVCRQVHPLPVFAIGGMTVTRVPGVIHAGAYGIAVCGAVLSANDPERVAQALALAIEVSVRATGARKAEGGSER